MEPMEIPHLPHLPRLINHLVSWVVTDELDILDPKPLHTWSSIPFVFQRCVCGSRIYAYTTYITASNDFDPQRLTESLRCYFPFLPYPYAWHVYGRVAAVVNILDLQDFHQIHPRDHPHQPVPRQPSWLKRLTVNQIYTCLLLSRYNHEEEQESEEEICGACQEEYQKNELIAGLRFCEHRFHLECMKKWLVRKNECPLCRCPAF
ncbi:hypothetical protein OSB04_025847 [Centaurea solstitialis]|uniref:RING-type E3 ubiquitin transferase n=1 Tax=Centaurea solstitialis TaxID=347529 RepID=A0AA38WBN4_9ASTR|nr:hypothetical protein OSB04_025847 [Centaurea solstitialis]